MKMVDKHNTKYNNEPIYLSVVLSTYNDSKYIGESINSVLKQSYPYFEFIIVNDGSTDNTLEIIKSFHDDRIVLVDKPNTGLIDSLNVGISKAKYDWIARMDGDDIADVDRFKSQVPYIEKGYHLIGGNAQYMDMDGHDLYVGRTAQSDNKIKFLLSIGISPLIHPSIIVKKQMIQKVGGYDSHIYCAEDKDMWLMLSPYCKMINVPQIVLRYRINPLGISVSKNNIQRLNGLISFSKYKNKIYRNLTDDEYLKLKTIIVNHRLYSRLLKFYEKEGMGLISRKYNSFMRLIIYLFIGKSVKL